MEASAFVFFWRRIPILFDGKSSFHDFSVEPVFGNFTFRLQRVLFENVSNHLSFVLIIEQLAPCSLEELSILLNYLFVAHPVATPNLGHFLIIAAAGLFSVISLAFIQWKLKRTRAKYWRVSVIGL